MSITYSFKITSVNRQPLFIDQDGNRFDNVITKINFYYQGTDENGIIAVYNSHVSLVNPDINTYKAFNELTEAELLSWLEATLTEDDLSLMQSVIERNINEAYTFSLPPYQI